MRTFETLQSVSRSLGTRGDRLAVLALASKGASRWSFASLDDHVRRLATGLIDAGVRDGEPVGLFAPNRPEWIVAALAILDARAVVVPMDAQARGEELAHLVRDSGTRRMFTVRDHSRHVEEIRLESPPTLYLLDTDAQDGRSWRRLLAAQPHRRRTVEPADGAALFYTAGTTGRPKGVPLTHANCASSLAALLDASLARPDDRVLLPLPFHHVYPFMIGIMTVLASGAALVTPADLTGPQVLRALREGEVAAIVGVPRFYEALVSGVEARARARGRAISALFRAALRLAVLARRVLGIPAGRVLFRAVRRGLAPSVRLVASGGARLDPDVARALEALGWEVSTGYGLTETAPILTVNVPGRSRLDTAGRPVRGVELRLDDPDGDGVGEVLARGPNVFAGYHNLPDTTAEAFTDGWFRTGDLGRFDRDGYLELVGRASEILVLAGGKNVPPEDVEKVYLEHPAIREIGVLLRDGRLAALVVPDPGAVRRHGTAPIENVMREAVSGQSRRLAIWQHVSEYAITRAPLPRTRLGKLRRHLLPGLYERARRGEAAEPRRPTRVDELSSEDRALVAHPVAKPAWDWLVARYRDQRVAPDTNLQLDLGIDSLGWLDLTLELRQRAGVELSEEKIAGVETVRDLLHVAVETAAAAEPAGAATLDRPEEVLSPEQRRWVEPPGSVVRALGIAFYLVNRAVLRRLFAIRADGLAHLATPEPCVLAPNHLSYLDPLVLAAALPRARLEATFWGGWSPLLFGNPVARLFSRMTHVVPVGPGRAALSSLAMGAAVLARRRNLVWFPEGGRSPTGELQPFQPGIGVLLDHFNVPVVPVFIHGTERALPPGRALPRRAPVTVLFGRPLDPRELATRGRGEDAAHRIADALHAAVAELGRRAPASAARRAA